MFLIAFAALALVSVPLAGGRLERLLGLSFRSGWLVPVALVVQSAGLFAPGLPTAVRSNAQIVAYLLAGIVLVANLRLPGLWLIGLGALSNFVVIAANNGVMPAASAALRLAGRTSDPTHFVNSMALARPRLAFLGDVFALPAPLPFHNVLSIGDACLCLGVVVVLHRNSGSRLLPTGNGQFAAVMRRPAFVRLWSSQVVSNLGDWTYALAVATIVVRQTHDPRLLALLFVAQAAPAALAGVMVGPLIDRFPRNHLMIAADIARAAAVASLLVSRPTILQFCLVGACLGAFGSVFQPSLQASIPEIVPTEEVVAANATVSATYHIAVMVGPALGGLLVGLLGGRAVFSLNAVSFLCSAAFLATLRMSRPQRTGAAWTPVAELREGLAYAMTTPLVRGILIVVSVVVMAAATKAPLEALFVLRTLGRGPTTFGLIAGAWGAGMLLGSVAAPAAARRWPRERLLAVGIGAVGVAVLSVSHATTVGPVLGAWLIAGAGNALGNISYESLLQERTPDRLRGRVFAAAEAVVQTSLLVGFVLAGWIGTTFGVRFAYAFAGCLLLVAAVLAYVLVGGEIPAGSSDGAPASPEAPAPEPEPTSREPVGAGSPFS